MGPDMEEQAQWIAGALLVHEVGLVMALRRGRPLIDIAEQFGVSEDMIGWRINVTGAARRAQPRGRGSK